MINFYPGPSRVYDSVPHHVAEAHTQGILSINHRSEEFMSLAYDCKAVIREKLSIPESFEIFFVSSATECWEIISQEYEGNSYHFYNGSFGEKWFEAAKKLKKGVIGYKFDHNKELRLGELDLSIESGTICITQNETSNGTAVSNKRLSKIRKKYPDHLIAIDATSSLAGKYLQFENGDLWFASVQKCFGLPAGLALMICSPKAVNRSLSEGENRHYNSLSGIIKNGRTNQTTHTPNVLAIYLLLKTLLERQEISKIDNQLNNRFEQIEALIGDKQQLHHLITNKKVKSETVLVYTGEQIVIEGLKRKAKENNIVLGNGYGEWKERTIRIANFPAILNKEMNKLLTFLDRNIS